MDATGYIEKPDFYTPHTLVDEFHMLQNNPPIVLDDKDVSEDEIPASPSPVRKTGTRDELVRTSVDEVQVIVKNIDILKKVFGTLGGKDKLAKISKYVLDLLKLFISKSRHRITVLDPSVLTYYSKVLNQLNLRMILKHPLTISKILLVALSQNFENKATIISTNLSVFRQILRFGGTPFRVRSMCNKLSSTVRDVSKAGDSVTKLNAINKLWLNEGSLGDFIDLYYGIMDELVLLHKFKVWSHAPFYSWVSKHEALSWYYDILLGLKKAWSTLQQIKQRQLELEIQLQVKKRAVELSSKIQGRGASPIKQQLLQDLQQENSTKISTTEQLQELQHEKNILYLDIIRLSFDFLADTTDVFNMKTPPGTYALLSLFSGMLGFSKLWITAKKELSS